MSSHQTSNHRRQGGQQGSRQSRSSTDFEREANRDYGSLGGEGGESSSYMEQASEYWERGENQMRELIRNREGVAILTALATGVGIGLVIGASIGHSHQRERSWRDRVNFEDFGRRLSQRMEGMIPETLAEYFGR